MTEAEAVELVLDIYSSTDKIRRLNANGSSFTAEQWEAIKALYDAEVAYVDYCVDEIVEHVRSVADGDTIFVVTADHGELFGEYGLLGHNLVLHDALVHVPLVVSGVDFDRDGDELVQHADVTQTLARIVGCGHEQFRGYDLRSETRKYCISQRGEADFDPFFDMNPDFDTTNFHEDPLTAVRTNEFKYLSSTDKTQLFALPDEETDVSDAHPELVETLSEVVHDRIDWDRSATASGTADFTDEMREQLADLGYL